MLTLPSTVHIYLASQPADMRKGPDGLMALVSNQLKLNPFVGHLFVFYSKRKNRMKALWWDHGGFLVLYKRLERGKFRIPGFSSQARFIELRASDLSMLLEGIDLSSVRRQPLWKPPGAGREEIDLDNPYA